MAKISDGTQDIGFDKDVHLSAFPAPSKHADGNVNGKRTEVSSVYFSDKILITISQCGRLSQWIQVPLNSASPRSSDTGLLSGNTDLLPLGHLTPQTLFGGGDEQRKTVGHLYATQIASIIINKEPEETRTLLVGLGLDKLDLEREAFFDLLELIQDII